MPPSLDLPPIAFETPMARIETPVLIEYLPLGETAAKVAVLSQTPTFGERRVDVQLHEQDKISPVTIRFLDATSELGDVALQTLRCKPLRAFALPPGGARVSLDPIALASRFGLVMLSAPLGLVLLFIAKLEAGLTFSVLLLMVLAYAIVMTLLPSKMPTARARYVSDQGTFALTELQTALPALSVEKSTQRVDSVKAEYGRLLSDIEYRITNSALFDPAVTATRDFTAALIQWDDSAHLSSAERAHLAARAEVAFTAARANAETLGIAHLPLAARDDGERAAKAARLSTSAPTVDERSAALRAVARILEGLALYYLPKPSEAVELVQGRAVRELPGRRAQGSEPT